MLAKNVGLKRRKTFVNLSLVQSFKAYNGQMCRVEVEIQKSDLRCWKNRVVLHQ